MNILERSDRPLSEKTAFALNRINVAMRAENWIVAGELGINPTQKQILLLLDQKNTSMRISKIAEELVVSKPTISDSVSALVEKNLLTKQQAVDDGRAVAIWLTPKGRRITKQLKSSPQTMSGLFEKLKPEEQTKLYSIFIALIRELQDAGRIPITRMCYSCRYFRPNIHSDAKRPHQCDLVGVALGDPTIRIDCPEHELA